MAVSRLIYYSENQIDPENGSVVRELSRILSIANKNNKLKNITGALIFDDRWFLQILEGERPKIWHMFEHIREDDRHAGVVLAEMVETENRVFSNWWMGGATRTPRTEAVFKPYLTKGFFDPAVLSTSQMLCLAVELAKLGFHRGLAPSEDDAASLQAL